MNRTPASICFGLDLDLDRRSCAAFLQLLGQPKLAETLAGRMNSGEIEQLVDHCAALLRTHLSEHEYHELFLQDNHQSTSHHD